MKILKLRFGLYHTNYTVVEPYAVSRFEKTNIDIDFKEIIGVEKTPYYRILI